MTQTLALLLDAYRELNARKMFWISLVISGLVMVAFALLGLGDDGLTLLGMNLAVPAPRFWYKYIFSTLVIGGWVSIGAMILALISTSSIYPDLLASGSIDLYLSKPISRLRLFLTKYFGGLLFVLLQATVFSVGSFLVFGLRAGIWRPAFFLLIPLTTLLFSYLFAVCTLVGVMTRSTIAAILLTVLFWLLCFAVNKAEQTLFLFRTMQAAEARVYDRQAGEIDAELADLKKNPTMTNAFGFRENRLKRRQGELRADAEKSAERAGKLTTAHTIVRGFATVIPKTGETVDLLDRHIFNDADLASFRAQMTGENSGGFGERPRRGPRSSSGPGGQAGPPTGPQEDPAAAALDAAENRREREQRRAAQKEVEDEANRAALSRSIPWILGTSIGFEVVIVSMAAWVFCRRDY